MRCDAAVEQQRQTTAAQATSADDPAPGRADRAVAAAAHQLEGRVHRRDGVAAGHPPGGAAPDQQAAERDDEGRNAEIGDDEALERADQQRRATKPDRQRDDPDRRIAEAEASYAEQEFGLRTPMIMPTRPSDRADRQIDVARDDDQHHAGRHDRDRRGLHREVPQIARRQEQRRPTGMCKPIQMISSAPIMPSMRVSSSVALQEAAERGRVRTARARSAGAAEVALRHGVLPPGPSACGQPAHDLNETPRSSSNRGVSCASGSTIDQLQAATEPAATPAQTTSLSIQPASMTTLRLSLVIGDRRQEHRVDLDCRRASVNFTAPGNRVHRRAVGELRGDFGRVLAEFARVLPDRHGLRAERDAVQRGMVAVLAGNRHGAGQALRRQAPRRRRRPCRRWRPRPHRPCCRWWSGTAPCSSARWPAASRRYRPRRHS